MFKQSRLRQQAKIDYQQARGTAHKILLQQARGNLFQQKTTYEHAIQTARKETAGLQAARNQKLKEALVTYLVHERLTDIPGIGEVRKKDILQYVYKGQLTDLRMAHRLPGIGEQTQAAINQWIAYNQRNFSKLLQESFPGKQQVDSWYQQELRAKEQKIATAQERIIPVEKQLDVIRARLERLERITEKNFYAALQYPGTASPQLDEYIQGVFAEWEQVPDWFEDVLAQARAKTQITSYGNGKTAVLGASSDSMTYTRENQKLGYIIGAVALILCSCCAFFAYVASVPEGLTTATMTPTVTETFVASVTATATAQPSATATATIRATATASPSPSPLPTSTATATATAVPQPQIRVTVRAANVRVAPDTTAAIAGVVRQGDILPVLQINEDETWFLVELANGARGWIGSSVVTFITGSIESP